jgi:hypothetical protein
MKIHRTILPLLLVAFVATLTVEAGSQTLSYSGDSSATSASSTTGKVEPTYLRPTPAITVNHYAFDAFGPYAIAETAFTAGIDQATRTPPDWSQGMEGYSERFGSDFGIAVVATTARYGLAAAFKQDTSYYRCECRGVLPRLRYAALSTVTGRRGEDGHRVFSIPALVAPYAGATAAVYGWYPNRYGAKDAFRMGNYSLLVSMGGNIALEFFYRGPHALISRMHRNHAQASTIHGPN